MSSLTKKHYRKHPECLKKALDDPMWKARQPIPEDFEDERDQ